MKPYRSESDEIAATPLAQLLFSQLTRVGAGMLALRCPGNISDPSEQLLLSQLIGSAPRGVREYRRDRQSTPTDQRLQVADRLHLPALTTLRGDIFPLQPWRQRSSVHEDKAAGALLYEPATDKLSDTTQAPGN